MYDITKVGEKIRMLRRKAGFTQNELAQRLSVSFQAISGWETSASIPDIVNLCRIASIFGTTTDFLLRDNGNDEKIMIGVDGGGTKSEFALFTSSGKILKTFRLPGTNVAVSGFDSVMEILCRGIDMCYEECDRIDGIFLGTAGSCLPELKTELSKKYPRLVVHVESDGVNALSSAKGDVALICGTGTILLMREGDGFRTVGGWGYRMGDAGSGYNLGRAALRAAMAYEDGITDDSLMFDLVMSKIRAPRILGAISAMSVSSVGALASVVFDAYRQGSEVAADIIHTEMKDLSVLIRTICKRGSRLIACGGVIEHYRDILLPILKLYVDDTIEFVFPKLPPIFGACVECCRRFDVTVNDEFEKSFTDDYNTLAKQQ